MKRRDFIKRSSLGVGLLTPMQATLASGEVQSHPDPPPEQIRISAFSKNLQWLDYDGMAETAAAIGFDGIDLTVRPGGHVLPEKVADDLPRAFEAVKKAGLEIYSIVTSIDNDDAASNNILKTAKSLGIDHYRLGWFHYGEGLPIENGLAAIREKLRRIEGMNEKWAIHGSYQNHEGHYFGAAIWDLATSLKEINARFTGSQYDIYHATIEGAHSWIYGFELLIPFIKTINVKDYQWVKKNGKWVTASVPLGEGMVNFNDYFGRLKKNGIVCPLSLHLEYPLGGADQGARTLTIDGKEVIDAMKRDLKFLRSKLKEAGLQ